MAVAMEMLTVRLPVHAVNRLRRVAEIAHRPVDEVVAETLQSTLPPLLEELPSALQPLLGQMESWSTEALRKQLYARVDEQTLDRYDALLAQNSTGELTPDKRQEMDDLRHQNDLIMFRKAYAALLLKWRGERIPTLNELEAAE